MSLNFNIALDFWLSFSILLAIISGVNLRYVGFITGTDVALITANKKTVIAKIFILFE